MRIMISCGEPSGDLYAGALTRELRQRVPDIDVFGLGGERFGAAGGRLLADFHGLSVTGLTEALRVLPRSAALLRRLTAAARELRPDVLVVIDFPDFNFRLMAAVRRLGVRIAYYVAPQLWAWRTGRMQTMHRHVDRVLVIFPFEEPLYREAGVPVEFVGHPLVDLARPSRDRATFLQELGLDADKPTVALLPGSRSNELHRHLPVLAEALPLVRARVPGVQFVVAQAPSLPEHLFAPLRQDAARIPAIGKEAPSREGAPVFVRGRTDDVLAAADVVIAASGTATVQCALHEKPMVVMYRLSPLTYRVGRPFVKVDRFAMANLVAERRIVPELIQADCTPARVADETVKFFADRDYAARTREALRCVRARLGAPGASGRAAESVLALAGRGAGGGREP